MPAIDGSLFADAAEEEGVLNAVRQDAHGFPEFRIKRFALPCGQSWQLIRAGEFDRFDAGPVAEAIQQRLQHHLPSSCCLAAGNLQVDSHGARFPAWPALVYAVDMQVSMEKGKT